MEWHREVVTDNRNESLSTAEISHTWTPRSEPVRTNLASSAGDSSQGDEIEDVAQRLPQLDWFVAFRRSYSPAAVLDASLRVIACNEAFEAAGGVRSRKIVGQDFFSVFPGGDPAQRTTLQASFDYVLKHGVSHSIHLLDHVERHLSHWLVVNSPLADEHGNVCYLLNQLIDITELTRIREALSPLSPAMITHEGSNRESLPLRLREAQQILAAERRRMEELFQQAPGFICILRGPRHIYEMANAAYYQLVGHRQIIGHELASVLPEIVGQGFLEQLDQVYATGVPFVGRAVPIAFQRDAGAELEQAYIDLMYQPIRDDMGRISGMNRPGF